MIMPTKPPTPYARLRALNIRTVHQYGRPYLLLQDSMRLSDKTLLVPQPLAMVLTYCDGRRNAQEMAHAFTQQYRIELSVRWVEELLVALDEAVMLENERADGVRAERLAAYRSAPFRPPALAGLSYPAASSDLWHLLQDYLEGAEQVEPRPVDWSRNIGLLSPHIDYPRGGAVYAQVWKRATQAAQEADLVVILGTDHYGSDPFTLTRQHYVTPYGLLPTAQGVVDELAQAIGEGAAFAGELRHLGEHSLELVAVWLHHIRERKPVEVAPILVGGFQLFL
jgi:hypothetical protein